MVIKRIKYGVVFLFTLLISIFAFTKVFTLDTHHIPAYPSAYGKTEDQFQLNGTVKAYNYAVNNLKAHEMTVNSRSWYLNGSGTHCWDAVKQTCTGSGSNTCSGPGQDIFVYPAPSTRECLQTL